MSSRKGGVERPPEAGAVEIPPHKETEQDLGARKYVEQQAAHADALFERRELRPDAVHFENLLDDLGAPDVVKMREVADRIPVALLLRAEKMQPGMLLELFAEEVKYGEYKINFQGNYAALRQIGAGDILPPRVRRISTIDDTGRERQSGERRGVRGDFYDAAGYMEILEGYSLFVLEEKKQLPASVVRYAIDDIKPAAVAQQMVDAFPDKKERQEITAQNEAIIEASVDHDVDPALMLAIRSMALDEDSGRPFGILSLPDAYGFEAQLNWALRMVADAEHVYTERFGRKSVEGNAYTTAFLLFLSRSFDIGRRFDEKELFSRYEAFGGRPPHVDELEMKDVERLLQRTSLTPDEILAYYPIVREFDLGELSAGMNLERFSEGEQLGNRKCASFVSEALGIDPPIFSAEGMFATFMRNGGETIDSMDRLKKGDIIFFAGTYNNGRTISHVGVMTSSHEMKHHGTFENGVQTVDVRGEDKDYYDKHFYRAVRMPKAEARV